MGPDKRYRAFISYSQRDKLWGKRIHAWLETYRVPVGSLVDIQLPRRLGKFFRDDEDMAAASDIADIVRRAIENAEGLIVICSPRSAQSKWVNAEIQHFRRTGRARKVFAVIIDGVPNSGDERTECFPPALRATGDPDDPDALPIEPVGLDVRKDGRAKACARLAAGLLGVDFDDLWQRDRRRAERHQRLLIGGLSAVSLVFAALTIAAVGFGLQARERAAILSIDVAHAVLDEGDANGALLLLLDAAEAFSATSTPDTMLIAFDEALQRAAAETLYPLPEGARLFDAPHGVYIADPVQMTIALLDGGGPPRLIAKTDSPAVFVGAMTDGAVILVREDLKIERLANGQMETLGEFGFATSMDGVSPRGGFADFITLSPDGILLTQPVLCEKGGSVVDCYGADDEFLRVEVFDLAARKLHVVRLKGDTGSVAGFVAYVRTPEGRRLAFTDNAATDIDSANRKSLQLPRHLFSYWCNGGAAIEDPIQSKSFNNYFGEYGLPVASCATSEKTILVSEFVGMSFDDRINLLFEPEVDDSDPNLWTRLDEFINDTDAYVLGSLRGNYLGQVQAVRYDGAANRLALAANRDLLVSGEGLFEWRVPNVIDYIQILGSDQIAVVDADRRFIRTFDLTSHHLYATRKMESEEAARYLNPSGFSQDDCPMLDGRFDGATNITVRPLSGARDVGQMLTIKLARNGRAVEASFPADGTCPRLSEDARFLGWIGPDSIAHIWDLRRLLAGSPVVEIGTFEDALDLAFSSKSPGIVLAESSEGVLTIRRHTYDTLSRVWRAVELFRGTAKQFEAKLDVDGGRAIIFEDLAAGAREQGGVLYSFAAQRVFRRLGASYRTFAAGFTAKGELYLWEGDYLWEGETVVADGTQDIFSPVVLAITPHDRASALAAAKTALSEHCRPRDGVSYRASPCWPARLAR